MFKKISSNLANDLVQKLPAAAKKFGNKSLEGYYNDMFNLNPKKLHFQAIQTRYISDLLKNCDINKAAGIDDLSGRFLTYSRNNKGPKIDLWGIPQSTFAIQEYLP